jgi:hypothetical protein
LREPGTLLPSSMQTTLWPGITWRKRPFIALRTSVYVNKHGDVSRSVVMEFVGSAHTACLYGKFLILFVHCVANFDEVVVEENEELAIETGCVCTAHKLHENSIANRISGLKPLGMFRLSESEFLVAYQQCAVYVTARDVAVFVDVHGALLVSY